MYANLPPDTIELLRIIIRGASLSDCAKQMNLSVSAVSKKIKKAEAELESPLFTRNNTRLEPTSLAISLLEHFDKIIYQLEMIHTLSNAKETALPPLRLCSNIYSALVLDSGHYKPMNKSSHSNPNRKSQSYGALCSRTAFYTQMHN